MNKWIPKNKFLTTVASIALLSVVAYFAGLFFILGEIKEIEDTYKNSESQSSKSEKAKTLKSQADANAEDIQTLRNFFIQKGDEIKFIEEIESLGRKSGVIFEIGSINLQPDQSDSLKEDVLIRINVQGSWLKIMSFVDALEKTSFGVSMQNISLDVDSLERWSGFIEFIIFRER